MNFISINYSELKDCSDDQSVCLENQACINIAGEYVCRDLVSCGVGFKLNADANQCQGYLFLFSLICWPLISALLGDR